MPSAQLAQGPVRRLLREHVHRPYIGLARCATGSVRHDARNRLLVTVKTFHFGVESIFNKITYHTICYNSSAFEKRKRIMYRFTMKLLYQLFLRRRLVVKRHLHRQYFLHAQQFANFSHNIRRQIHLYISRHADCINRCHRQIPNADVSWTIPKYLHKAPCTTRHPPPKMIGKDCCKGNLHPRKRNPTCLASRRRP